jgi:hypothetical protein
MESIPLKSYQKTSLIIVLSALGNFFKSSIPKLDPDPGAYLMQLHTDPDAKH